MHSLVCDADRWEEARIRAGSPPLAFPLSGVIRRTLKDELVNLVSPYVDLPSALHAAYRAVICAFGRDLLDQLVAMRTDPTAPGVLLIRNLPIDPVLPQTPADGGTSREKSTFVTEGILLGIASVLGLPFSYKTEKDGVMVHNICPVQGREEAAANDGSLTDFKMHVECAYFEFRPDYLLLLCLRPDRDGVAATLAAEARSALLYLSPQDVQVLRQPLFQIRAPQSFEKGLGGIPWSKPQPVLSGPPESPMVRVNLNGARALSPIAERALRRFDAIVSSPPVMRPVVLEPGELLVVDNRKALHGRNRFAPRYDGFDRWLQRVYVKADLLTGGGGCSEGLVF